MFNLSCEFYDYEPNEHRRCILLGYCFSCGSQECKKAREKENDRTRENKQKSNGKC